MIARSDTDLEGSYTKGSGVVIYDEDSMEGFESEGMRLRGVFRTRRVAGHGLGDQLAQGGSIFLGRARLRSHHTRTKVAELVSIALYCVRIVGKCHAQEGLNT